MLEKKGIEMDIKQEGWPIQEREPQPICSGPLRTIYKGIPCSYSRGDLLRREKKGKPRAQSKLSREQRRKGIEEGV